MTQRHQDAVGCGRFPQTRAAVFRGPPVGWRDAQVGFFALEHAVQSFFLKKTCDEEAVAAYSDI